MASHPDEAALTSLRTELERVIARLVTIADAHRDDPDDPLTPQLDELERALESATRRLDRTIQGL